MSDPCSYIIHGKKYTLEEILKYVESNYYELANQGNINTLSQNIYLNGKYLNPNTPIHELSHVWAAWAEKNAPDVYNRGMELVSTSRYMDRVKNNPFYQAEANKPGVDTERYYREEALAMAIGDKGAQFVTEARKNDFVQWLKSLWSAIKNTLSLKNISAEKLANLTFDEFSKMAAADILRDQAEEQDEETRQYEEDFADRQEWEDADTIGAYEMETDDEVKDMLSGPNITRNLGYAPEGDQGYRVQRRVAMLQDGKNMIGLAMAKWGSDLSDYGRPLFNYVKKMSTDNALMAKKAVLLATFLGEIREEINRNPQRADELKSLDRDVTEYYQRYMNQRGKEVSAGALLRLYRDKYMGDIFVQQILEEQQIKDQNEARKALQQQQMVDEAVKAGIEEYKKVTAEENEQAQAEAAAANIDNAKVKQQKKKMSPVDAQKNAAAKADEIAKKNASLKTLIEKIKDSIKDC